MLKKILIIGLGGSGQRHIIIIIKFNKKIKIETFREKKTTPLLSKKFKPIYNSSIYKKFICENLSEKNILTESFQMIIISNPTSLHLDKCFQFKNNTDFFLVEKPFSNQFDKSINFIKKNQKKKCFLTGYQKVFEPTWNLYKKKYFSKGNIQRIYFKTHSDVRKWHPYENYMNLYACRKKLGGGVILTECHEIRYAFDLLGMPISVFCYTDKKIDSLDVETSAIIIMSYKKIQVIIELNMMSSKIERSCEIISNTNVIFLDFNKKSITAIDKGKERKMKLKFNNDYNFEQQWKYAKNIFKKNKIKEVNLKTLEMIKLMKNINESKYKKKEIYIK
jgi:predicted dehydrogenase